MYLGSIKSLKKNDKTPRVKGNTETHNLSLPKKMMETIIRTAHSDLAESYVLVPDGPRMKLELQQVKRILGHRVEIVSVSSEAEQETAVRNFDRRLSASQNAERMQKRLTDK